MRKSEKVKENNAIKKSIITGSGITTLLFLMLIFSVTIASGFPDGGEFSDNENRYLAERPKLTMESLRNGSYTSELEKYLQDHVVLREKFVSLRSVTEKVMGKDDNGLVFFGKNGQLFQKESIDLDQLEHNVKYVNMFSDKYKSSDICVRAMIVPTAEGVLKDDLPENAGVADQDRAIDLVKGHLAFPFVDVRDILNMHDDEYIYYRTDHHWTSLGAYYAYQKMKGNDMSGRPEENGKTKITVTDDFYGTLYSKSLLPFTEPDEISIYKNDDPKRSEINMTILDHSLIPVKSYESIYDDSYLNRKDKYSYFLSGNNPVTVIEKISDRNESDAQERNMLIIKDSYAHSLIPFLTEDMDRIVAVDMRYMRNGLSDILKKYDINEVLFMYNIYNFSNDRNIAYILK